MADWDEKYIVTKLKWDVGEAPWSPQFEDNEASRLLSLDNDVIKGAFYMETAWFWPGDWPANKGEVGTIKAHTHDFNEVIAFVGTDPKDPYDLGGVLDVWIDGRQNIIDKSFLAFVPAGVEHGPIRWKEINKPVFHFTSGMSTQYNK
ncbi:MAG: cupin domain-containing protein [Dehalococcoidales bacterium]|nr:cupin domain-containing protein [Dehalococcoidales bacterium]